MKNISHALQYIHWRWVGYIVRRGDACCNDKGSTERMKMTEQISNEIDKRNEKKSIEKSMEEIN